MTLDPSCPVYIYGRVCRTWKLQYIGLLLPTMIPKTDQARGAGTTGDILNRVGTLDVGGGGGYQFYISILRKPNVALSNLRNAHVALSNIRNVHFPCLYPSISHVACH